VDNEEPPDVRLWIPAMGERPSYMLVKNGQHYRYCLLSGWRYGRWVSDWKSGNTSITATKWAYLPRLVMSNDSC